MKNIVNKIKRITWEDVWDKSMDVLTWLYEEVMTICREIKNAHAVYPQVIYTALVLILIALFV